MNQVDWLLLYVLGMGICLGVSIGMLLGLCYDSGKEEV